MINEEKAAVMLLSLDEDRAAEVMKNRKILVRLKSDESASI